MRRHRPQFKVEEAESIAITGLGFLGQDAERLGRYLAITGVNPADLRERAATREFLASVLDYILQDESLLLVFTSENSIEPALVKPARYCLSSAGEG